MDQKMYALELDKQMTDRYGQPLFEEVVNSRGQKISEAVTPRIVLRNNLWEHRLDSRMPLHERRKVADGIRSLLEKMNQEHPQFTFDETVDMERFVALLPTLGYAVAQIFDIFPEEYWKDREAQRAEDERKANGALPDQPEGEDDVALPTDAPADPEDNA